MKLSLAEVLFVAAVLMLVFSASRMSALGNALGKLVYSFKRAKDGEGYVDAMPSKGLGDAQPAEDAQLVDDKSPGA